MNLTKMFGGGTVSPPYVAASIYGFLLLGLAAATVLPLMGMLDRRAAVESQGDMLLRLEGRSPAAAGVATGGTTVVGSPFLEGATITVAGAALLQRVVAAVT